MQIYTSCTQQTIIHIQERPMRNKQGMLKKVKTINHKGLKGLTQRTQRTEL